MGRLHPIKRVDMTIEAFAQAAKERPDIRLLLLGKGETDEYEQSLRELANRLGVADKVIFAGWVLGRQARGLSAAKALVLNSVIESFGYVLFEAIGRGHAGVDHRHLALAREFQERRGRVRRAHSVRGSGGRDGPCCRRSRYRGERRASQGLGRARVLASGSGGKAAGGVSEGSGKTQELKVKS